MKKFDILESFYNDRKHLIAKYPEWKNFEINNRIITITTPQLLAGFAGYLKYKLRGKNVYYRGESAFHESTIPSLFRFDKEKNEIPTEEKIELRFKAHNELIEGLKTSFKATRFKNENIEPILQHYGIKTSWIDLVDNLFVSIWFSNYDSKNDFTYIKFFGKDWNDSKLLISNLIIQHSSLSLRPHCQHGFAATKKNIGWNMENIDFSSNIIAIAKIPNNESFRLNGEIFSDKYMFPGKETDNTFKLLETEKFKSLIIEIVQKYSLSIDEIFKK